MKLKRTMHNDYTSKNKRNRRGKECKFLVLREGGWMKKRERERNKTEQRREKEDNEENQGKTKMKNNKEKEKGEQKGGEGD
jgi:hypothetical protein